MKTFRFENGAFDWMIPGENETEAAIEFMNIIRPNRGQSFSIHPGPELVLSPGIIPTQMAVPLPHRKRRS